MLPLMVRDGAIPPDAGAWLAASNYLGYLAGALVAGRIRLSSPSLMLISLVGTGGQRPQSAPLDGLAPWLVLRFTAGVLSAWTLVATSTWAMRELTQGRSAAACGTGLLGRGIGHCHRRLVLHRGGTPGRARSGSLGRARRARRTSHCRPGSLARLALGRRTSRSIAPDHSSPSAGRTAGRSAGIVICYGLFGFGYILPATFLPALAREVVDDPQLFGLAWPIFGIAAAVSTLRSPCCSIGVNRLRVWACSHLLMAAGVVLPTIWLSMETIASRRCSSAARSWSSPCSDCRRPASLTRQSDHDPRPHDRRFRHGAACRPAGFRRARPAADQPCRALSLAL